MCAGERKAGQETGKAVGEEKKKKEEKKKRRKKKEKKGDKKVGGE